VSVRDRAYACHRDARESVNSCDADRQHQRSGAGVENVRADRDIQQHGWSGVLLCAADGGGSYEEWQKEAERRAQREVLRLAVGQEAAAAGRVWSSLDLTLTALPLLARSIGGPFATARPPCRETVLGEKTQRFS